MPDIQTPSPKTDLFEKAIFVLKIFEDIDIPQTQLRQMRQNTPQREKTNRKKLKHSTINNNNNNSHNL